MFIKQRIIDSSISVDSVSNPKLNKRETVMRHFKNNDMKISLTITLFFLLSFTYGQSFDFFSASGIQTQKSIEKNMDKEIIKGTKNGTITSFNKSTNSDTLAYFIQHTTDPFSIKFTFKYDSLAEERYCEFIQVHFDCSPCAQKHVDELIKMYKFKKKSTDIYISSPSWKTEMIVKYETDNKNCILLQLRCMDMPKKQRKELYKRLK